MWQMGLCLGTNTKPCPGWRLLQRVLSMQQAALQPVTQPAPCLAACLAVRASMPGQPGWLRALPDLLSCLQARSRSRGRKLSRSDSGDIMDSRHSVNHKAGLPALSCCRCRHFAAGGGGGGGAEQYERHSCLMSRQALRAQHHHHLPSIEHAAQVPRICWYFE